MPDYSREELVTEMKRRRATKPKAEPNVPEWAGRYPNLYGAAGAAYEAIQPFMRGSLIDVGLSKAVGYPTPEFMTEEETMMLPIVGMYGGPSAKGVKKDKGLAASVGETEGKLYTDVVERIKRTQSKIDEINKQRQELKEKYGTMQGHGNEELEKFETTLRINTHLKEMYDKYGVPEEPQYTRAELVEELKRRRQTK